LVAFSLEARVHVGSFGITLVVLVIIFVPLDATVVFLFVFLIVRLLSKASVW
jgi:hypothetical protein